MTWTMDQQDYLYSKRMMKSASLRNLVLLIRAKVWDRACNWYGVSLS